MRIIDLNLDGIGPFRMEQLQFIDETNNIEQPPVAIITGENGTGKTIILDAIRGLMFGNTHSIGRDIFNGKEIIMNMLIHYDDTESRVSFLGFNTGYSKELKRIRPELKRINTNSTYLQEKFSKNNNGTNWIASYWSSNLGGGSFEIKSLTTPDINANYLNGALSGEIKNTDVTALMVFFDYLQDSKNPNEKKLGTFIYRKLKEIIQLCLNDGELSYISRTDLKPMVRQNGQTISLDKLSSGNLYLVQRMVDLLGKMYAVSVRNNKPIEELCNTRGLLLIDEAENHLHPKWQKTFIKNILHIFPNLQIILTTHSPFIVASVENAKIFVCESAIDHCVIKDETATYSNKPIEEILMSPLFGHTSSFNDTISTLLEARKIAIQSKDFSKKERIEKELQEINPEYFAFFDIDKMLYELNPDLAISN
jgi:AAA15 family ATPase/GTPase